MDSDSTLLEAPMVLMAEIDDLPGPKSESRPPLAWVDSMGLGNGTHSSMLPIVWIDAAACSLKSRLGDVKRPSASSSMLRVVS